MTGKAKPAKPGGEGYGTEVRAGQPAGCAEGVIMPDGTVVRGEGEPPVAKAGTWWPPRQGT